MSQVRAIYHIVICTLERHGGIKRENEEALYRFIWDIVKQNKSYLIRIGGMEDHIHILLDLYPDIALSKLVQNIKRQSSHWMKSCGLFPDFKGWGKGYFAATRSESDKDTQIEYIKNQKIHHQTQNSLSELQQLYGDSAIAWEEWKDIR